MALETIPLNLVLFCTLVFSTTPLGVFLVREFSA